MIAELLTLLGSGPVGALIGGGLAILNRRADLQVKQAEHQHEQARWGHESAMRQADLEQVRAEAAARREVAVIEADAAAEAARLQAVGQAQASDRVGADILREAGPFGRWLLVLATFLQTLVRPALTTALVGVALWMGLELLWLLRAKTWGAITPAEQRELALQALSWVMAQASACVQYWMVSRGTGK